MKIKNIGEIKYYGKSLQVSRNEHGKFIVSSEGKIIQRKLSAEEIVRYLLNMMNDP